MKIVRKINIKILNNYIINFQEQHMVRFKNRYIILELPKQNSI